MAATHGVRGHGPLLRVESLRVTYGDHTVVDGVSFDLDAGESLALVGGSGSGKTRIALALLGLLDPPACLAGLIPLGGEDRVVPPEARLNALRGPRIGIVFQDALSSLTPHLTLGAQIAEGLAWHRKLPRAQAWHEAVNALYVDTENAATETSP